MKAYHPPAVQDLHMKAYHPPAVQGLHMKAYHPPAVQALKAPDAAKRVKWAEDFLDAVMLDRLYPLD